MQGRFIYLRPQITPKPDQRASDTLTSSQAPMLPSCRERQPFSLFEGQNRTRRFGDPARSHFVTDSQMNSLEQLRKCAF